MKNKKAIFGALLGLGLALSGAFAQTTGQDEYRMPNSYLLENRQNTDGTLSCTYHKQVILVVVPYIINPDGSKTRLTDQTRVTPINMERRTITISGGSCPNYLSQ